MVKNAVVLARGKSLNKFSQFSHLFDTIYIVGNFYKEIKKIGLNYFKDKKIIHIISRTDRPLRNDYEKKLNIIRLQTMYYKHQLVSRKKGKKGLIEKFTNFKIKFLPEYMKNRGYPLTPRNVIDKYSKKYNNYKDLCCFLENKFEKEIKKGIKDNGRSRYWPTTGIFALDLCLTENNPENFYIFGVDYYLKGSYVTYNWEKKVQRDFGIVRKLMIYHTSELAKEYSSTSFYCASDVIKLKLSNWNVL